MVWIKFKSPLAHWLRVVVKHALGAGGRRRARCAGAVQVHMDIQMLDWMRNVLPHWGEAPPGPRPVTAVRAYWRLAMDAHRYREQSKSTAGALWQGLRYRTPPSGQSRDRDVRAGPGQCWRHGLRWPSPGVMSGAREGDVGDDKQKLQNLAY